MKRLVVISDVVPDPQGTGSEQRTYSFLLAYSKICEVELWCQPRLDHPNLRRISRLSDLVSEVYAYYPTLLSSNRTLRARFLDSLRQAHAVHLEKMPVEIRHDRIIWDIDELPAAFKAPSAPIICEDPTEPLDPAVARWVAFSKLCKIVTCSSTLEASALLSNAVIVPNCYASPAVQRKCSKSKVLLFVGHLGYPPNVEAVDFFCKEILPKLPDDYLFRVVGKKPIGRIHRSLLDSLGKEPRIQIYYDVESCSQFYQDALAAVVPLLQGSGTRFKILEAFAHNCPVISTSKGCEGHDVTHGKQLLICNDADSFAQACQDLCNDTGLSDRLSIAGLSFLEQFNSQSSFETILFGHLRQAIPSIF
ncbi:MAG: glycosyltransferase family 4 protein [Oligoflexia bacterium]|nr:glycosyltransferase family 4 protein [Oligoflexia bacterium]